MTYWKDEAGIYHIMVNAYEPERNQLADWLYQYGGGCELPQGQCSFELKEWQVPIFLLTFDVEQEPEQW